MSPKPKKTANLSKMMRDLNNVPNIVGGLGVAIAHAQKALNQDYLESLEKVIYLAKALLGDQVAAASRSDTAAAAASPSEAEAAAMAQSREFLKDLVTTLAPSRYQYSETTLSVKLDLAQSVDASMSGGLGFGYGAVSFNASMAMAYSQDYRAAAECRTVLHAIPPDRTAFSTLLERAATLSDKSLQLPPRSEVDQNVLDLSKKVFEKLTGAKPLDETSES